MRKTWTTHTNSIGLEWQGIAFRAIFAEKQLLFEKKELLNPLNVLKKGYTVTEVNNKPLKSIKDVKVKDELKIKVIDGEIDAVVEGVK